MPSICLYFQVHQPRRLRHYAYFDIGRGHDYEDKLENRRIIERVAAKCYLPTNALLLRLIEAWKGRFRLALSLSGVIIEELERYRPDVLESFRRLASTGCCEFLNETESHSLALLFSPQEFREQVERHRRRIKDLFGQEAKTFRNTELIYNNDLARTAAAMGYQVILAEGTERLLGTLSPNRVYRPPGCDGLALLLRNYRLSDDVAFRFSDKNWPEYPLTADKYAHWLHQIGNDDRVVNLFMDYETFGEHQWADTGIFAFLEALPDAILRHPDFTFQTPSEVAQNYPAVAELDCPETISWADEERDTTAWLGNPLQCDASRALYALEDPVRAARDKDLLKQWRLLQTSDHFYYMCTKWFADGDVHCYFNPYESPYEAYINYMNVLDDLSRRVRKPNKGEKP